MVNNNNSLCACVHPCLKFWLFFAGSTSFTHTRFLGGWWVGGVTVEVYMRTSIHPLYSSL